MNHKLITGTQLATYWAEQSVPSDIAIARIALDNLVSKFQPAKLGQKPLLIHMLAIPGSGKSTIAEMIIEKFSSPLFHLGFDRIMEAIPQYQEDLAEHGKEFAFKRWELPARIIGYELFEEAINSRTSILFDHTGTDENHIKLLHDAKRKGFHVVMVNAETSIESAITRAAARNRHMPEETIRVRQEIISRLSPAYHSSFPVIKIPNDGEITDLDVSQVLEHLCQPKTFRYF